MANMTASLCARQGCRRPMPPQHGKGRRRQYCSSTCRSAAHYEQIHGIRCAVRVGSRSCLVPAVGFIVAGDLDDRIACCEGCRAAVQTLLHHAGARHLGWDPLAPGAALPVAATAERPQPGVDAEVPDAVQARPPADYVGYAQRRQYMIVDDLGELTGPTTGVVRLPQHLDWSGSPTYDLNKPAVLAHLYEVVLRESSRVEDLRTWLDGDTLRRLWPQLFVPQPVRRLWENRFAKLARARVNAPAA